MNKNLLQIVFLNVHSTVFLPTPEINSGFSLPTSSACHLPKLRKRKVWGFAGTLPVYCLKKCKEKENKNKKVPTRRRSLLDLFPFLSPYLLFNIRLMKQDRDLSFLNFRSNFYLSLSLSCLILE